MDLSSYFVKNVPESILGIFHQPDPKIGRTEYTYATTQYLTFHTIQENFVFIDIQL
jgi:hypothetical protein